MEQFTFNPGWFGGGCDEKPILPFSIDDGEELDPEEELLPRKDYGPIGQKKKVDYFKVEEQIESTGLIFSWVSDFIRPGGELVSEEAFKRGFAPGMPPKPKLLQAPVGTPRDVKMCTPPGVMGYSAGSTTSSSSSSGYSTCHSMNEYEPPSPPAGAYMQFPPSQHVQYSLLRQVQEQQQLPTPLPPKPPGHYGKKMSARESSNYADMKQFAEQYGICGKPRPNHYYRPRKGKYFKKFEES